MYDEFLEWIDGLDLENMPKNIVAYNFNLYDSEETYDIQLIGSDEFDEDDPDWACSEVYSSEENVCYIEITDELENWEKAQKMFAECVRKYLESGKYAEVLKSAKAVGIGFVDGDIEILYLDGKII